MHVAGILTLIINDSTVNQRVELQDQVTSYVCNVLLWCYKSHALD